MISKTAGREDYGAQLGDAAATTVVEVHKRKAGPGHGILQERDRRCLRQAMLTAQMQNGADKAKAAVSVVITAARPVAIVGKKLEHEIEQLHRFCDFRFLRRSGLSGSARSLIGNSQAHANRHCGELIDRVAARGQALLPSAGVARITAPGSSWPQSTRMVQRKRRPTSNVDSMMVWRAKRGGFEPSVPHKLFWATPTATVRSSICRRLPASFSGSHLTRRWRETDSNPRSPVRSG
jgi:hypothetical protein